MHGSEVKPHPHNFFFAKKTVKYSLVDWGELEEIDMSVQKRRTHTRTIRTRILKIINFVTNIDPFFGTMLNLCLSKSYIFTSDIDYFKFIFTLYRNLLLLMMW